MGEAYECDRCGKFFPGVPYRRYLPRPGLRDDLTGSHGVSIELCHLCETEFDKQMHRINQEFFLTVRGRRKGHIKDDSGHEEGGF